MLAAAALLLATLISVASAAVTRSEYLASGFVNPPPSGMSYRYLLLPDTDRITLPLAGKVKELVDDGARVIGGRRPQSSPNLTDYPQGDAQIEEIAAALWDSGRVASGKTLGEVFKQDRLAPDFEGPGLRYIHRRDGDTDIYFVANPEPRRVEAICSLRSSISANK
jgi:hypothetical protein